MKDFNKINNTQEIEEGDNKAFELAVAILGSRLHEDWRKTRLNEDGSYEPRIKQTSDQEWISKNGTIEVDIANTTYDNLPEDWRGENKAAAAVIVGIFDEYNGVVELDNPIIRSRVGNKVHDAWLDRNGAWAPESQKMPFDDLSIEEQEKDLDQVRVAKEVFGE